MSHHRTAHLALSAALAFVLIATGCSSGGGTSDEPTHPSAGILDSVTWTQDGDNAPIVDFETPLEVEDSVITVVRPGEGAPIGADDTVAVHVTLIDGATGEVMSSTYDTGRHEPVQLGDPIMDEVLISAIVGQSEGVRLLYARPPSHTGAPTTMLMAITVERVVAVLDRAHGEEQVMPETLPEVMLDASGAPSIVPLDGPQASAMAAFTRVVGEGDPVVYGDNVVAHYTGWLWDGTEFDSSWNGGAPLTMPLLDGAVIDGWIVGLVDQNVGSQVVLVLPSDYAYGDQNVGPIPPGSTLIFVVDILAVI